MSEVNSKTLKSLRETYNWEIEAEREEFRRRLYALIKNWKDQFPDIRGIFRPEEIDWLLVEDLKTEMSFDPCFRELPLVRFVAGSGYRDEPELDRDSGKPLSRRNTPVHHLFKRFWFPNWSSVIRELFKIYARFDVNYSDESGTTHFHAACRYGLDDAVEKFLEAGQDPNCLASKAANSTLHYAVQYGHARVTELLLRGGADPNLANVDGSTALHIVCKSKRDGDVWARMLFEMRDDVRIDARDKRSQTPLHLALSNGNEKLAELLLRRGADPNLADAEGRTPLHVICGRYEDDEDLAKMFFEICDDMKKEVWVDARDKMGRTPLQFTVASSYDKLAKLLLRRGVDPNLADSEGSTPLHLACQRNNLMEIIFEISDERHRLLRVDARDKLGRTPLQYAVAYLLPNKVDLLLGRGADLSNFAFPAESYFGEKNVHWPRSKLCLATDVLITVERLEKSGYELERGDALTIMKFFAKHAMFEKLATDEKKPWYEDKWFAKKARPAMMKPRLSLHDLIQLPAQEAAKLLTSWDYLEFEHLYKWFELPTRHEAACVGRMREIQWRGFLRRWAMDSFLELMRFELPILCCEVIVEKLENRDLCNICLAVTDESSRWYGVV